MPVAHFVDCSVCGFSLDGTSVCVACGSENQSAVTNGGNIEKETIPEIEIDNTEDSNVEDPKLTTDESIDLSMNKTSILPFDIDDAPTHSSNEILPYGLDYAPFFPQ
jgi:hypothetical protein